MNRLRLSVCLLAGLLSTPCTAQEKEPCFSVTTTSGQGLTGSILINRCTGETWILTRVGLSSDKQTFRWLPITGNREPPR